MDDDRQAIRRVLDGDVDAFELLIRRHGGRVFSYLAHRLPPDEVDFVAQEAFIKAFRALESFREQQPFDHWLLRIACRCSCDYWRERKTEMENILIETDENNYFSFDQALVDPSCDSYRQITDMRELKEQIHGALNELDEDERSLVEDIYFDNLSHREAAERRGCSAAGVRTRIHRIRRDLQRPMNFKKTPSEKNKP
ncbi:MAG: sigma-70 family RNA polymerase sigma factor [Kiritimatiellae bacterium]|nr:sigma-70 family RNA polymerase sigma factor [Kiritimatiellia bacterium]